MGHYAKIENGIVTQVIVAEKEIIDNFFSVKEHWIKTSYNTFEGIYYENGTNTPSKDQSKSLRKNYAGIGFTYDSERDAFISPKPYNSWLLNEENCRWEAPIEYPTDGKMYSWSKEELNWIELIQKP